MAFSSGWVPVVCTADGCWVFHRTRPFCSVLATHGNSFFKKSTSIVSFPIVLYSCSINLSFSSLPLDGSLKTLALCSFNCLFHWEIWFGWSPYFLHRSDNVWFSGIASKATFALNSAVNFRRLVFFELFIFFYLCKDNHFSRWSEIWGIWYSIVFCNSFNNKKRPGFWSQNNNCLNKWNHAVFIAINATNWRYCCDSCYW